MLRPLLGSTADASTAYADHFGNDGNRVRDLLGWLALVVASAMLVWTAIAARHETVARAMGPVRDLATAAATITASVFVHRSVATIGATCPPTG